jgi:gas vesicle protein
MNDKGTVVVGVLAGVAFGAILGLLLAPQKGEALRRTIRRKGEDMYGDVEDLVDEATEKIRRQVATVLK